MPIYPIVKKVVKVSILDISVQFVMGDIYNCTCIFRFIIAGFFIDLALIGDSHSIIVSPFFDGHDTTVCAVYSAGTDNGIDIVSVVKVTVTNSVFITPTGPIVVFLSVKSKTSNTAVNRIVRLCYRLVDIGGAPVFIFNNFGKLCLKDNELIKFSLYPAVIFVQKFAGLIVRTKRIF